MNTTPESLVIDCINTIPEPFVIYHDPCTDGIGAAWCFWRENQLKDGAYELLPGKYQEPPPDVFGRDVFLVDFSYKREVLEVMLTYANSITMIDHHVSAIEDVWDLPAKYPNFKLIADIEKSGAILAWEYLNPKKKPPVILEYIQDRDLWKFELPHSREINAVLRSLPITLKSIDDYANLTKSQLKGLVKEGQALLRKEQHDVEMLMYNLQQIDLDGEEFKMVNCPGFYASAVGEQLSKEYGRGLTYYDTELHRVFSLRSLKGSDFDVARVAQKYGGGGHKHAAGFKLSWSHDLLKLK